MITISAIKEFGAIAGLVVSVAGGGFTLGTFHEDIQDLKKDVYSHTEQSGHAVASHKIILMEERQKSILQYQQKNSELMEELLQFMIAERALKKHNKDN